MNISGNFISSSRQESEESWRQRLDDAHERYQMASALYRELLEKAPGSQLLGQDDPVAVARDAESAALAEYMRLLKIVTDSGKYCGKRETPSRVG